MNLLFLTEIDPFPPNGGEKLRSYGLLKLMSDLDLNVHAITANTTPDDPGIRSIFKGIRFYSFGFNRIYSNSRIKEYYQQIFRARDLSLLINSILQDNPIDVAFIDYHFYGQYIRCFHKKGIPVIYGTHNAQARLVYQRPANSFIRRILRFGDYLLSRFHEYNFFRRADALIVVSDCDKEYHARFISKDKITVIPNFLIESDYTFSDLKKENYILMTANFWAYQNSFGLEWFIREVWDSELWNKTQLILVGMGSDKLYASIKEKYTVTNIKAVGEVYDLKPYISKAMVSIVPLQHGSGTRLKCLESMALKTQLISTSKGAEGIEHDHSIIIADTPADFKNALLKIIDTKTDLTDKAYDVFLKKYSLAPNKALFAEIINCICNPSN
jgi:hypothetical protein